jgi:hypothetical protein
VDLGAGSRSPRLRVLAHAVRGDRRAHPGGVPAPRTKRHALSYAVVLGGSSALESALRPLVRHLSGVSERLVVCAVPGVFCSIVYVVERKLDVPATPGNTAAEQK